jgi:hypothetical protein
MDPKHHRRDWHTNCYSRWVRLPTPDCKVIADWIAAPGVRNMSLTQSRLSEVKSQEARSGTPALDWAEEPMALSDPPPAAHGALGLLLEAADYARVLDRGLWDFAVEIDRLVAAGANYNDLRWLVCRGYVDHAREITLAGGPIREFDHPGGLSFQQQTCFVLTEAGESVSRALAASDDTSDWTAPGRRLSSCSPLVKKKLVPKWDRDRQQLRLGGLLVKQYKAPAVNQEIILAAFEEEGWPIHIDDPLTPNRQQDPKRRLHDTINALNRNQINPLIRFIGDGRGQGVRWELTRLARRDVDLGRSRSNGSSDGEL